ncbi:MAG: hypothetical protein ABF868_02935 [Sporolactobacillus sp.]
MMAAIAQVVVCYAVSGLILTSLLGLFPVKWKISNKQIMLFTLFLLLWFPLSLLALLTAPIARMAAQCGEEGD